MSLFFVNNSLILAPKVLASFVIPLKITWS